MDEKYGTFLIDFVGLQMELTSTFISGRLVFWFCVLLDLFYAHLNIMLSPWRFHR